MNEEPKRWQASLSRPRSLAGLGVVARHIDALSAGDRFIFRSLAVLVCVISLLGLYALEQSLLVEVPAYGGSITEGMAGSPSSINPLLAISDTQRDLTALTYAGLMGLSGEGKLVPVLAEKYSVSDDGKVYTFTLRKSAVFSDGTPVTANDVVFTVQRAQDPGLKSPVFANWAGVSAEVVDARTVRFTLAKSYAPFLSVTTLGILPARLWQGISNDEFPFSTLDTKPVGAGPFVVSRIARDGNGLIKSMELSANRRYVLGRPYLDRIRIIFFLHVEDMKRALEAKSIDSAYGIAAENYRLAPSARIYGVFWNSNTDHVYARAEVRKALSIAIDRMRITSTILGGLATPIMGPVPPGGELTQAALPAVETRIADAASVLTAAGWKYDGLARVWKNAKAKLSLDGITLRTSNVPELKNIAQAVRDDWEQLGVPVTIELYEPGDLLQNVIRPRKYEALLFGLVSGRDHDLYAYWHSQERNDPGLNIALYANKNVDAWLEDARTNPDPMARAADLQKIEDTVSAEYPAAFIYSPDFVYALPRDIGGVELPQIATSEDRFATVARWYRLTDRVWPFFTKTGSRSSFSYGFDFLAAKPD